MDLRNVEIHKELREYSLSKIYLFVSPETIIENILCPVNSLPFCKGVSMIYDNVKKYAVKRNISIRELEKRAGISNGTIGKWTRTTPKITSLQKVAAVLKISVNTLTKED